MVVSGSCPDRPPRFPVGFLSLGGTIRQARRRQHLRTLPQHRIEAQLIQAVAKYAARLAEKLRRAGLGTDHVTVFIHTSEHDRDWPQRSSNVTVDLPEATSDTILLTKAARWDARRVWRDGFAYTKAGLITNDLVPLAHSQRALLGIGQFDREHRNALMAAMDHCNKRWGPGTVVLAAAGF